LIRKISNVVQLAVLAVALAWVAWRWNILVALCVFLALAAVSLPVFLVFVVLPSESARRRKLTALAAQHGWSYHRQRDPALAARLPSFLIPAHADAPQFSDVVAGTAHGWPFLSFHRRYTYWVWEAGVYGYGDSPNSVFHWFVLLEGLPTSVPVISCWRRRNMTDLGPGFQAGDYPEGFHTGNHAFDEAFHLDGPSILLAHGLAGQIGALMPRLAADVGREFPWRLAAGTLFTWQYNGLHTDPRELQPLLAALAAIAQLLSQHERTEPSAV
jgi:hypothetical protein